MLSCIHSDTRRRDITEHASLAAAAARHFDRLRDRLVLAELVISAVPPAEGGPFRSGEDDELARDGLPPVGQGVRVRGLGRFRYLPCPTRSIGRGRDDHVAAPYDGQAASVPRRRCVAAAVPFGLYAGDDEPAVANRELPRVGRLGRLRVHLAQSDELGDVGRAGVPSAGEVIEIVRAWYVRVADFELMAGDLQCRQILEDRLLLVDELAVR